MKNTEEIKILAAAIYEIRILLVDYLGSNNKTDPSVRLSAHLAHALHNEAEMIINGGETFDIEFVKARIRNAEKMIGSKYANNHWLLSTSSDNLNNQER